jgi:hypothetical protein
MVERTVVDLQHVPRDFGFLTDLSASSRNPGKRGFLLQIGTPLDSSEGKDQVWPKTLAQLLEYLIR